MIRFGGLATGIDTEKLIQDMMRIQRLKVDRVEQQKIQSEWKRDAYNVVNKTFANFVLDTQKNFGFTQLSGRGGLLSQSVSSLSWVRSATSANKDILGASARADAIDGNYQVKVTQLASNWSAASTTAVSADQTMEELLGLAEDGTYTFKIETGKSQGEVEITLNANDTMATLAKKINDADLGVIAQYDRGTGRFFLQTKNTGAEAYFKIAEDTKGLFEEKLGLSFLDGNGNSQAVGIGIEYKGQNAIIDFGAAQGLEFQSNKFVLNGISFDLKATGDTTITVGTDVDGVYDKIKEFVDQYNDLLDVLSLAVSEERYPGFAPLTNEQRRELSDKEIENWEAKAKSGLLKGDMYINNTISAMRRGLYESVVKGDGGGKLNIFDFGITTEPWAKGAASGKLTIDETKLKDAIRNDVDQILELFFAQPDGDVTDVAEKRSQTGLVSRLYGDVIEGMKNIISKAGPGKDATLYRSVDSSMLLDFVTKQSSISLLDKDIKQYTDRMERFNAQLLRVENRLWAQFTAMEKAISEMNSRSAWLAQQFGGGMQ